MKCVELFAGAGGLALGASNLRFKHAAVVELNPQACNTIRANQRRGFAPVMDWPLMETDVHKVDFTKWNGCVEIVTGGPPCQPFSIGGKHRALPTTGTCFPRPSERSAKSARRLLCSRTSRVWCGVVREIFQLHHTPVDFPRRSAGEKRRVDNPPKPSRTASYRRPGDGLALQSCLSTSQRGGLRSSPTP